MIDKPFNLRFMATYFLQQIQSKMNKVETCAVFFSLLCQIKTLVAYNKAPTKEKCEKYKGEGFKTKFINI